MILPQGGAEWRIWQLVHETKPPMPDNFGGTLRRSRKYIVQSIGEADARKDWYCKLQISGNHQEGSRQQVLAADAATTNPLRTKKTKTAKVPLYKTNIADVAMPVLEEGSGENKNELVNTCALNW